MADAFTYDAKILQTNPADIEKTRVSITGPDGSEQVQEAGKPTPDSDGQFYSRASGFTGHQGDTITVRCVNLDDGDPANESEMSEETLVLQDTVAPQRAGAVTIEVTGETDET